MNQRICRRSGMLILVMGLLVGCAKQPLPQSPIIEEPIVEEPKVEEPVLRHPFNGEVIETEIDLQAFAIMVSNSKEARPQTGLGLADIVYEISVDGWSITRFMAIFASNHPTKVGPVRSARLPFAELMREYQLPFAHFGSATTGEGDALSVLQSLKLPLRFDGHRGLNDEFFFRDSARSAPHNAYFNAQNALTQLPSRSYEPRFLFNEESTVNDQTSSRLDVHYSSYNSVRYDYDAATSTYLRSINQQPMNDLATQTQVSVKNIILLHAPHRDVETVRYVLVDFVGEGKAHFFSQGSVEEGTWRKESGTSLTHYYDSQGQAIVLSPGNTWIQVVHPQVAITIYP